MPSIPPINPAATVIVLRDTRAGMEVFLVRRHHAVVFMAGAHVFPGGRVDADDALAASDWCDGMAEASRIPGVSPEESLAFHVAAARELFEEAGVLVARDRQGEFVSLAAPADRDRFKDHRVELNAGRRGLRAIVTGEGLKLALDSLHQFAHWVTPPIDIKRFDTRFFVTRVPPHQHPVHDDGETTDSVWTTPGAAIAATGRDEMVLPPPTWATLRELERFASVEAALAWARVRPVYRREPQLSEENGVRRLVLPGDPICPEPEPVAFETRFVLIDGRWRAEPRA